MLDLDIFRQWECRPFGNRRQSAVLLLIQTIGEEQYLILEKRALTLRTQPGDISFPGGRIEPEETPSQAAVRETCEEVGLKPCEITLIGPMEFYVTHYGAVLYPFVGITAVQDFVPSPDEVDRIIRVPLAWLMDQEPEIYTLSVNPVPAEDFPYDRIQGGRNYRFSDVTIDEYFYRFENHHIWGTTARILHHFLERLKQGQ